MFKKVSIIGFGLIGSSIAREIRKYKLSKIISACDISKSAQKEVKSLRLANEITSDVKTSVKNADLVFICSPLSAYKQIFLAINKSANKDAIITDVGSSKLNVVELAEKILSKNLCFVPGHPIAGTEESGPKSGFLNLFKNRWFIITPSKLTKKTKIKIEKILEKSLEVK
jgi:Prephenate dehydrogenase